VCLLVWDVTRHSAGPFAHAPKDTPSRVVASGAQLRCAPCATQPSRARRARRVTACCALSRRLPAASERLLPSLRLQERRACIAYTSTKYNHAYMKVIMIQPPIHAISLLSHHRLPKLHPALPAASEEHPPGRQSQAPHALERAAAWARCAAFPRSTLRRAPASVASTLEQLR
jgi:hypothetical protein